MVLRIRVPRTRLSNGASLSGCRKGKNVGLEQNRIQDVGVLRILRTRRLGRELKTVDECTSTNDLAGKLAEGGARDGLVIIALTQTAGKGRLGRPWCSPRGGIWMSILLRPKVLRYVNALQVIGALAIAKSIVETLGVGARVRWPNDVMVDRRKIAGVLVESKSMGNELAQVVLGMGINANIDTSNIGSIAQTATSLQTVLGRPIDLERLIAKILEETEVMIDDLCVSAEDKLLGLLRGLDCSRGRQVKVSTAERRVVGLVDDYEALGRVRIVTRDGVAGVETDSVISVDYQSD